MHEEPLDAISLLDLVWKDYNFLIVFSEFNLVKAIKYKEHCLLFREVIILTHQGLSG